MTALNFRSSSIILTTLSCFLSATAALASPATKALAEARQQHYLETKKLGAQATPAQLQGLSDRVYGPANAMMANERAEVFGKWKNAIKAALSGPMKNPLPAGATAGRPGEGIAPTAAGAAPTPVRKRGREADTTTGVAGGAAGGKDVTYGGKEAPVAPTKSKLINEDGIFMGK